MSHAAAVLSEPPQPASPTVAAAAPSVPAVERARVLAERQLAMLERLAEGGMEIALAIEGRVKAACAAEAAEAVDDAALSGLAMAHARVARAVRLTLMLQAKVMLDLQRLEDRAELKARSDATRAAAAEAVRLRDPEQAHKARVERIVERVTREACAGDEAEVERLMVEACERLDDEDLYGKVLSRPVGELVALICRDLGLDPDWTRLAEEAWAQAEIETGAEGSPFLAPGTCSAEGRTCPQIGIAPDIRDTHPRSMSLAASEFRDTG